jgi:hypothetical protein
VRLQLVGGIRPGPSWSLLLNLPVLTAVATKSFLVPAPATPVARPVISRNKQLAFVGEAAEVYDCPIFGG